MAYETINNGSGSTCTEHCYGGGPDGPEMILGGIALVAAGGAITYAVVEYFRFSRVPLPAAPSPSRTTVVPTAFMRPGGGGLGFVGTF